MGKGIFKKTLLLVIILSLIPFIFINFYYYNQLKTISSFSIERSKEGFDKKSINSLITQASEISDKISIFLESCLHDLYDASLLKPTEKNLLNFSKLHKKEIVVREPNCYNGYFLLKKEIPIYKKVLFLSHSGKILINIEENSISNKHTDKIFQKILRKKILKLKEGEIFISHLIGRYVSKYEQLAGADTPENAIGGKKYRGYYIFAKKNKNGIIILCLDNDIIMEFVMHTLPNSTNFIDFPVYSSGNYAFLVDNEGWTIAHPKFWDIRGYDKNGELVPPYSINTPKDLIKKGIIPFNLATAGFIHKNYPLVLKKIQQAKKGCVNTTNIGGIKKVMAFAPIFLNKKVFGGVTIGAKVLDFHKDAITTQKIINKKFQYIKNRIFVVTFLIIFFIITGSFIFTKQITSPIIMLSRRFTELGKGNLKNLKVNFKSNDEIGVMGREFNNMIDLIKVNNQKLEKTIDKLESSQGELEFKVNLLEGIREFFTKFNYHNKIDEILNAILFIGKKIFKYDYGYIKIFSINKEAKIGFPSHYNGNNLSYPIVVENSVDGIFSCYKQENITEDERKNFEIFAISLSKFLENLKLYSEIIKERNFIQNIFKNMINGLIYINNDGYITHINNMAKSMFNFTDEIIGKKFREVFKNFPEIISLYIDTIQGKKFMVHEVVFKNKIYGCSSSLIENNRGIIMIFRDITEKKLTDEHLKKVDRFISMGRVAAGIAHEIRNPLTGITLLLDDLHDKLGKEDKELIKKALNEITRLENIVSELLDYASPLKEKFDFYDIVELIETSVFFIKKQAKQSDINITIDFQYKGKIFCSIEKIKQALINILLNAIDAIERKGEIHLKILSKENYILISIKDSGKGINKKDLQYIFDPFFTTKSQGTGLGLSITHSIILEHKGTIEVNSKEGKGTEFIIKIPI